MTEFNSKECLLLAARSSQVEVNTVLSMLRGFQLKFMALRTVLVLVVLLLVAKAYQAQDRLWTRMAGSSGDDVVVTMAVDTTSGAIYVAGQAGGILHGQPYSGNHDSFLIKYANNGTRIWTKMVGTGDIDGASAVVVDSTSGDVYVTGNSQGSVNGATFWGAVDLFLIKYASNGTRIWTTMLGGGGFDQSFGMALDASTGAIYVAGRAQSSLDGQPYVGSTDLLLVKYASNGNRLWTRMTGTSGLDFSNAVTIDPSSGAVYMTGSVSDTLHDQAYAGGASDIFLMKYSSNGTRIWTKMVGTAGEDIGLGVSLDTNTGDVFVVGRAADSLHGRRRHE